MSGDWEPGEVALVNGRVCINAGDGWEHGDPRAFRFANHESLDIRPLVVIDPEDAEQVELLDRLIDAAFKRLRPDEWEAATEAPEGNASILTEALREFARPAPRIEEPTGLGAVVEDANGTWWVRANVRTGTAEWRSCDVRGDFRRWLNVDAVRILSPGVTP